MSKMKKIIACIASMAVAVVSLVSFTSVVSADIAPNPVISRDCPAYSGSSQSTAYAACDAYYYSSWYGTAPDYLAYDLSAVPEIERKKVIAVWYNNTANYDYTIGNYGGSSSSMPTEYTIEVNASEGGAYPADGWVVVDTVTDNTLHSRQHLVDILSGKSALEFLTKLVHKGNIHLMVEKAVNLEHITGLYNTVFNYSFFQKVHTATPIP